MASPITTSDQNADIPDEPDVGTSGFSRRRFMAYLISAPTLTMGVRLGWDAAAPDAAEATPGLPDLFDLTDALVLAAEPTVRDLIITITEENKVVMQLPRGEVGQGITTGIAMLLAEEFDARLEDVQVPLQDARPANMFNQLTGGSSSMTILYQPVREVARAMWARLVTAASDLWGVPANQLTTPGDTMVHAPDGRTATYGSLAAAAGRILIPRVPTTPKDPAQFRVIGQPTTNINARDIATGRQKYTLDLDVDGAKPTVVARPPTIKGTVRSYDDSVARSMPGVVAIARIPTGVAVVADTFDEAQRARDALQITWNPGPMAGRFDSDIRAQLEAATPPILVPPLVPHVGGVFNFAFANHAPLETMVAIADVRGGSAEVWGPNKMPITSQWDIARKLGIPQSAVTVHVIRGGSSFGRRLFWDPLVEAAQISQRVGRPVKLLFTRTDDMKHGRMRPVSHHKIQATHLLGSVLTYEHRVATAPLDLRHGLGEALTAAGAEILPGGFSQTVFHMTENMPYDFGVETYLLNEAPMDVATAPWRSVYSGTVACADEIMVDEIARALGRDPLAFRRQKLSDARARAVIDRLASAGQWGRPMPPGHAQGVAIHEEYHGFCAYLVEIDATDPAAPRVTRGVGVVDVGRAVNPRGVEHQVNGSLIDGISVVLHAGNHIDNGAVRESSYTDFPWARQRHSPPEMEVHVMPPNGEPGGAGELGLPSASAAVANAYARATGTRPRNFPILGEGA
ncbi:MAG: molybdopterin cofactor-binding domain-containing protein [Acidimicrobiales bacterium]